MDVNLLQCLLIACVDTSVTFLQSDKSKRSILWQCCANVLSDWSPTDWQPLSDRNFKKPPHRWEIFSITGPYWKKKIKKFKFIFQEKKNLNLPRYHVEN